jgi:hypothetical protein
MFLVEFLDAQVHFLSSSIGKPDDQMRLLLCMLVGLPIGWIMNGLVKGTNTRHLYSIILGFLL